MSELPLFPLSAVLLPYGRMPLRIFERRYLDLVRDCMKNSSPFGVVWIRRGAEVAQRGRAAPELGDYGTCARIVDWDQLPNGLLGITIEGTQRFQLHETESRANDLTVGHVDLVAPPEPTRLPADFVSLLDVLRSLEAHPHVQRMNSRVDYHDAWQVGYTLVQILPMEESLKYQLLGSDSAEQLLSELHAILNRVSGEE